MTYSGKIGMKFKGNFTNIIILFILALAILLRANWYGNLRLSISNAETASYIDSSRSPVLSWKSFAGQRLFTTNMLYKVANDEKKCPITAYSSPASGEEEYRDFQPCFDKIVLLQNFLAMFGWAFLAWTIAGLLKNPYTKIAIIVLIILFGFTPQIAEWDSILSPESLSLSMFTVTFAMLIKIAFRASESEGLFSTTSERLLLAVWLIIFLLWVFVRDVHLYAVATTLAMIAPLFLLKKFRGAKPLTIASAFLMLFFVIGFLSARDSLRATRTPLMNSLDEYIWPHPQRVEYFKGFGMPERSSPGYQEWADINAPKAFGLFLISHPGFIATTSWEQLYQFKSSFIQPYFYTPNVKHRDILLILGEIVHPETIAVYLIDFLLLISLSINALRHRSTSLLAWTWLALWYLAIAAVTLLLSFFGDTWGTRRHIFPSVEMFRLFMWVFLMPFLDLSLEDRNNIN